MALAQGQRFMRLGASRYPPVYVSICISMAQTGASGAAAVELMLSRTDSLGMPLKMPRKISDQWEISAPKRRQTLM